MAVIGADTCGRWLSALMCQVFSPSRTTKGRQSIPPLCVLLPSCPSCPSWFKSHLPTSPQRPKVAIHLSLRILFSLRSWRLCESQICCLRKLLHPNDRGSPIIIPFASFAIQIPLYRRSIRSTSTGHTVTQIPQNTQHVVILDSGCSR